MSTRHHLLRYLELAGAFASLYVWTQSRDISAILGFVAAFGLFMRGDILWTDKQRFSKQELDIKAEAYRPKYERESAASKRQLEEDRKLFEDLLQLINSDNLSFLKHHDHGETFHDNDIKGITTFVDTWDRVEREFLDPQLEQLKREFYEAAKEYIFKVGGDTFSDRDRFRRLNEELFYQDEQKWEAKRSEINELADKAATTLESLIRAGRKQL